MRTSRKAVATLLSAGVIATGAVVSTAPAAQAASTITFCFDWPSGNAFAGRTVYLMRKIDGKAVRVRKTTTGNNGCGRFAGLRTDRVYWVKAVFVKETKTSKFWWAGRSPLTTKLGGGTAHLGTGKVRVVRAISAVGPIAPHN